MCRRVIILCRCKSRDVTTLRSGEHWDARLLQLIDQADIFQLFWSRFSAQSPAVKKEWEHALTLKGKDDAFIRPVYWREPIVPPPQPLQHINFAYCPELGKEENLLQKFRRTIRQFGLHP
ncbi:MAG: toll/interleukin-1 receptor domain-containing protein [Chloroflexi bacterium]|nr:toll/interleukin-1 receptor domain-containing protein [Chloroflexota bacterium]